MLLAANRLSRHLKHRRHAHHHTTRTLPAHTFGKIAHACRNPRTCRNPRRDRPSPRRAPAFPIGDQKPAPDTTTAFVCLRSLPPVRQNSSIRFPSFFVSPRPLFLIHNR